MTVSALTPTIWAGIRQAEESSGGDCVPFALPAQPATGSSIVAGARPCLRMREALQEASGRNVMLWRGVKELYIFIQASIFFGGLPTLVGRRTVRWPMRDKQKAIISRAERS